MALDLKYLNKQKKEQLADLSILPPCQKSLFLHMERSNYIANLWKSPPVPMTSPPRPSQNGWYDDCTIQWIDKMYPHDIASLMLAQNDDIDEIYGKEDDFNDEEDY